MERVNALARIEAIHSLFVDFIKVAQNVVLKRRILNVKSSVNH